MPRIETGIETTVQCENTEADVVSDSDTDSSIDGDNPAGRNDGGRYNLRREVNVPSRYGEYVVHYAKLLG